jgi:hypothetical protein
MIGRISKKSKLMKAALGSVRLDRDRRNRGELNRAKNLGIETCIGFSVALGLIAW